MTLLHPWMASIGSMEGTILFWVLAAVCGGSALAVVLMRNIVRTAVALLLALIGVSGLYFMLSAEFVAAAQLVVYVGGTLILIIFGVMLTSRTSLIKLHATPWEAVLAGVMGCALLVGLGWGILHSQWAGAEERKPEAAYSVGRMGTALLADFLLPFEMLSVVLLVVMIGAAYLARGRRREIPPLEAREERP